jgi:hypothetical protein
MGLSIEAYDAAARAALAASSNRTIECVQPLAFGKLGYPATVHDIAELARYAEVMHEGRHEALCQWLGGFTSEELELVAAIAKHVAAFTAENYGRRCIPRTSLVDSLHMLRHVRYVGGPIPPATLEIGAGSGYVGALLTRLGVRYTVTDVTQAFYLYQSHLLEGPGFCEGVTDRPRSDTVKSHLPWWQFYTPAGPPPIDASIVVCNHALCEMHPHARNYVLHVAADLLAKAPSGGAMLFSTGGSELMHPIKDIIHSAALWGLAVAFRDDQMTVLVHSSRSEGNPAAACIAEGRRADAEKATHGPAAVDAILQAALGQPDLATDDERFLRFVRPS